MKKTVTKTKKDSKKDSKKKETKKEPKVKKQKKPKEVLEDHTPTILEVWDGEGHKTTYKIDFEGHII